MNKEIIIGIIILCIICICISSIGLLSTYFIVSENDTITNSENSTSVKCGSIGNTLNKGSSITRCQSLKSSDGSYELKMQEDGNLVLYNNLTSTPLWASKTNNKDGKNLILQEDGNLVLYNSSNRPLWATNTFSKDVIKIVLENGGYVAMYNSYGSVAIISRPLK